MNDKTYTTDWAYQYIVTQIERFYKMNLYGILPSNAKMLKVGFEIASAIAINEGNVQKYQAINLLGYTK